MGAALVGAGTQVLNTGKGIVDVADNITKMLPTNIAAASVVEGVTGLIQGKGFTGFGTGFDRGAKETVQAYQHTFNTGADLLKAGWNLSLPGQTINGLSQWQNTFDDWTKLSDQGNLNWQTASRSQANRASENPTNQTAIALIDGLTGIPSVIESGGDPKKIGAATFNLATLVAPLSKAKAPEARALTPSVPEFKAGQVWNSQTGKVLDAKEIPIDLKADTNAGKTSVTIDVPHKTMVSASMNMTGSQAAKNPTTKNEIDSSKSLASTRHTVATEQQSNVLEQFRYREIPANPTKDSNPWGNFNLTPETAQGKIMIGGNVPLKEGDIVAGTLKVSDDGKILLHPEHGGNGSHPAIEVDRAFLKQYGEKAIDYISKHTAKNATPLEKLEALRDFVGNKIYDKPAYYERPPNPKEGFHGSLDRRFGEMTERVLKEKGTISLTESAIEGCADCRLHAAALSALGNHLKKQNIFGDAVSEIGYTYGNIILGTTDSHAFNHVLIDGTEYFLDSYFRAFNGSSEVLIMPTSRPDGHVNQVNGLPSSGEKLAQILSGKTYGLVARERSSQIK